MRRPDYVIFGPDPRRADIANPGGQLTATTGLLQYAEEKKFALAFVDTLQGSFPLPSASIRIGKVMRRQMLMLWYATVCRPRKGVLIFAAGPGSFIDRSLTGLIARLFGVKAVICLRSGRLAPYLGGESILGRAISVLIRIQSRVLVQGNNWLPDLRRAGVDPSRICVVANWISPTIRRVAHSNGSTRDRPVRFVFVGWLVAEKGICELIEACEYLAASGAAFELKIVGGGTLYENVSQRILASGLQEKVLMTGWVEPVDVAGHVEAADVFVLPTYFEGFPNSLIEAFALGLPAISTPVGAIPDSLVDGENGFLVPPKDARRLAEAMARYIREPELVSLQSTAAIAMVHENHDFQTNCARLFKAVEY